jgi:hypothetical protein
MIFFKSTISISSCTKYYTNVSVAPASRWAIPYQLILKLTKVSVGKCHHIPPYLYTGLLGMKMLRLRDTVEKVQVHASKKQISNVMFMFNG